MKKSDFIIVINGNPISASRPRVAKRNSYYNEPYRSYKATLAEEIANALPKDSGLLFEPYEPLSIEIVYEMPIPKM